MPVAEKKVNGGKFVRLEVTKGPVNKVLITGDFFIYPEEGISIIEETLSALKGDEKRSDMEKILSEALEVNCIQLLGVDGPSIIGLYIGALLVENNKS
ncbi:hypothetical protein CUJ83_09310 [Methanocella sp. CWC-04]|uniref:Lipoate--protein ligase n=1 Tax=Methanooceanicella nereidis TaxID=2052831 RepID=A0AAP2RDD6_9EURY|nr:hypothetical protein [Methanocella sp. CWC-04]MCD1295194.1 hypothetical protein [Methanocella sp. CWC-04]